MSAREWPGAPHLSRTRALALSALQALVAWPTVPAEVAAAVREAARIEPDDRLRAAMAALLADRG